jgi:glycine oxidase
MIDFIIVGRGLAATTLMHSFHQNNLSFKVVGNETLSSCSKVAAGIWNPIVFKRLTKSWLADELIPYLTTFYKHCENLTKEKFVTYRPIIKPFTEEQEKKLWMKKAKEELESFLEEEIQNKLSPELEHCLIQNGYGIVKNAGNLNTEAFLDASSTFFKEFVLDAVFEHHQLEIFPHKIIYKGLEAKHIVFCEGFLVKDNPFFNWIPLKPAKGEVIHVQAPSLVLNNSIFNRNGFLMGLSTGTFKVGATYAWDELTQEPTQKGLEELKVKLECMITADYTVVKHEAGIRPSSIDRRPIIGAHPLHENLFVFNGLGTKGVMLAPYFAKNFVNFYLQKEELNKDVNVNRFYHLYGTKK